MCLKYLTFVFVVLICIADYSHAVEGNHLLLSDLPDTMTAEELLRPLPDDHTLGNKNAKIIIVEYASVSCMHCATFNLSVMPEIEKKYIKTGKVLFIYRDFPLDYRSLKASMLGFCYNNADYFKYHKAVFSSIDSWSNKANDLGVLENIAKISNIRADKFQQCISDEAVMDYVIQQKFLAAKKLDVNSTPTLFINGIKYEGMHEFEFFAQILDDLIKDNPNYSPVK